MMSHQLGERIRNHADALDQAAPSIRLDDVRASSRSVSGRSRLRPLVAAAAVVLVVVGGLVAISAVRDSEPEPTAVSTPLSTTPPDTTATEPSVSEALEQARTRWADAAVTSYRLDVAEDRNYWSRGCKWTTVVSSGVVTESTIDPSSATQECPPAEWTVEELHDLVSSWLASIVGDHTLQVAYNQIGVPVTMEYDLANGDDEESSMRVTFGVGSASTTSATSAPVSSVGRVDASLPDRDPDVTGVVGAGVGASQPTGFLAQASDSYYDGMGLGHRDGEPLVVGQDGAVLSVTDLNNGDEIAVWVEGGCRESMPVQCDVVAIRVIRPAP